MKFTVFRTSDWRSKEAYEKEIDTLEELLAFCDTEQNTDYGKSIFSDAGLPIGLVLRHESNGDWTLEIYDYYRE